MTWAMVWPCACARTKVCRIKRSKVPCNSSPSSGCLSLWPIFLPIDDRPEYLVRIYYTANVDLHIRPMGAGDLPAGLHLSTTANWNQLAEDWRIFLRPPHLAFLAERSAGPVGSVACARYGGLDWIAMMLVAPEERGAGIGGQLMRHVLAAIEGSTCVGLDAT